MREAGTYGSVIQIIRTGRGGKTSRTRPVVLAVGITLAIQVGFSLANSIDFDYDYSTGIVGWAAVHDYPIQQETIFWLMSVLVVAAALLVSWTLWLGGGWLLTSLGRTEPVRALTQAAASLSWFLVLWLGFSDVTSLVLSNLVLPVTLAALTLTGLITRSRWRPGAASTSVAEDDPTAFRSTPLDIDDAGSTSLTARSGWTVSRKLLIWLILPVVIYMTHRSPVPRNHIDLFHEGEYLYPMREVLDGAVPFRDIYLQHGLLHNAWFPALCSLVTGETEAAGRVTRHLLQPLGAVAMYLLGITVFRGSIVRALLLVFFFSTCTTDRFIFMFTTLALALAAMDGPVHYSLLRAPPAEPDLVEDHRRFRTSAMLFASGFAAAMAFWHTLDSGVFSIVSTGLFLFIVGFFQPNIRASRRPVPLLVFGGGVAVGLCLFGAYFLYHGALGDLFRNVYVQSVYHLDIWGTAYPSLRSLLAPLNEQGWLTGGLAIARSSDFRFFWPPAILLIAVAFLIHHWLAGSYWSSRACVAATLIALAGVVQFRGALGRSDLRHLASGTMLVPVLVVFVLNHWATRAWKTARASPRPSGTSTRALVQLAFFVLMVLGFGVVMNRDFDTIDRIKRGIRSVGTPAVRRIDGGAILPKRGPVALKTRKDKRTPGIARLVEYIRARTEPEDYVFDFSNHAALLFLAERRSPTRYFMAVYASPPALQREVISALEDKKPPLVIFRGGYFSDHFDGVRNEKRLPLIAEYLQRNYQVADRLGNATFLERR